MEQQESIVGKGHLLLKYSIPILNRLPRSQKFVLGDRIQNLSSDLLEVLIEAFYESVVAAKQALLRKANIILEKLRHYWRLGHELGYYASGQLGEVSQRLLEIGRMVGGWLNSLKKHNA